MSNIKTHDLKKNETHVETSTIASPRHVRQTPPIGDALRWAASHYWSRAFRFATAKSTFHALVPGAWGTQRTPTTRKHEVLG